MPGFLVGPQSGFVDRMKGKGMCSSGFVTQIGNSTALSAGGGSIFTQLSAAGVGNGADTTDDTLMSCSLPARLFDISGRCVTIQLFGSVTAGAMTKTVQFKYGAAALQPVISYATGNAGTWSLFVQIYKISANVQGLLYQADGSGTVATMLGGGSTTRSLLYVAGAEVDTAAIPLIVTGKASTATASQVLSNAMIVDAYN